MNAVTIHHVKNVNVIGCWSLVWYILSWWM